MPYIRGMKQIATITFAACLALSPAYAQDDTKGEVDEGLSLMEQGARLMMRGLMNEMEPAMKDLRGMVEEMGPGLAQLREMIGDFTNYYPPEVLPNGDIIIRRKTPLKVEKPLEEGEIEL